VWWLTIAIALVGAVALQRLRGWRAFGLYVAGALAGGLVLAAVSLTSDPCFPLCVSAGERRSSIASATAPLAALGWAAVYMAREPVRVRWGRAARFLFVGSGFLALAAIAGAAESSVEVTACSC